MQRSRQCSKETRNRSARRRFNGPPTRASGIVTIDLTSGSSGAASKDGGKLTCASFGEVQGGGAEPDRLAATFAVARVYGDLVAGARLEVADRERWKFARLVVHGPVRPGWRVAAAAAAGAGLTVHLDREILRQTTVEPLGALHVQRVRSLVLKRAIVWRVRVTWRSK